MKRLSYVCLTVFLSCFIHSCDKSYLDTSPTDSYNETNWWKAENQVVSTLNGCYAVLRNGNIGGGTYFQQEESFTPNSYSMGLEEPLAVGEHNPGNDNRFYGKWNALYQGIGRVNYLLENIDKVEMETYLNQRIKGEAYFLRAFFYSNAVNYFGGVPLILDAPNFDEHASLPRNSREEVIDQVLKDLDNAASALPISYSGSDIGRATKGAALALKARVLLYESKWSEASIAAKQVMEMEQYELFPDYRGLFMLENENNGEVIFDVQFKVPEYGHSYDQTLELFMRKNPTLDLVNDYLMIDGKSIDESSLFDPEHPYENRDPRLHQTIIVPGSMFRGVIATKSKYYVTGYGFKKYLTYEDEVPRVEIQAGESETNFILLRYADVLLMYAEAQNEASGPDATVYNALNQIRDRAGMPDIPLGLTKDEIREIIWHERRIELAGESLYYHDIRRWRIAEDVMNAVVKDSDGEVVRTRRFDPKRDYLWPIHEITKQENPALEQNPNY